MSTCTHLTVVDQVIGHIEAVRALIAASVLGDSAIGNHTDNLSALVDRKLRGAGDGALIAAIAETMDAASRMAFELPTDALDLP